MNTTTKYLFTFLGYAALRDEGKSNYDAIAWLDFQHLPQTGDELQALETAVYIRYPHLEQWLAQFGSDLQMAIARRGA